MVVDGGAEDAELRVVARPNLNTVGVNAVVIRWETVVLDSGLDLEPAWRDGARVRRDGWTLGLHGVRIARRPASERPCDGDEGGERE